ncbi:hypothetical protein MMC26_004714 [Xylographa opegraphella]|nr:hypothetical protein [Xylographa opegraphella]
MANQEIVRVPQTADDLLRFAVPEDEMPTLDNTMNLIRAHIESKSETKYGAAKSSLFPTAEHIAEIKAFLETIPLTEEARSFCPKSLQVEGGAKQNGKSDPAAQWRHGKSEKYRLDDAGIVWATGESKGGYVVPREQVHNVLVWAHHTTGHGGRDPMYTLIKRHYCESSFSKAFINDWAATCGHQKCQKKPRGAKRGLAAPLRTRATARQPTVAHQEVRSHDDGAAAPVPLLDATVYPAYSLEQAVPEPETMPALEKLAAWTEPTVSATPRVLFNPAELPRYDPVPPMANDEGGDPEFNMDDWLDFSTEFGEYMGDFDVNFDVGSSAG